MFGFFHKSILGCGLLDGFTDIHSHIMYGVDDGMKTVEDSLAALDFYERHGVKRVYLTPHIMENLPRNTPVSLQARFEEIRSVYKGAVELRLGAEYMLDGAFRKHLEGGLLPILGNKVLVETYSIGEPAGFENILYDIQTKGHDVLLAHPERYAYMAMKDYAKLKRQNIYFQLNLLSLAGIYGQSARAKAEEMLRVGMYDYIGSDMHHLGLHIRKFGAKILSKKDVELLNGLKNRSGHE